MKNQGKQEAWITFAEDDEAGVKALVLAKSLRRLKTIKKISITVGPSVTEDMWEQLKAEFDWVSGMDVEASECDLNFDGRAKLSCFKMSSIESAIVVSPDILFLQNCDEIFDSFGETDKKYEEEVVGIKPKDVMGYLNSPMIRVTPSHKTYNALKSGLNSSKSGMCLHDLPYNFVVESEQSVSFGLKYGLDLDLDLDSFERWVEREEELKFVHFVGKHPLALKGSHCGNEAGPLEKSVLQLWKELHFSLRTLKDSALEMKDNEPIAIIGMTCRMAGSNNVEEFWDLMLNKGDGIIKVPEGRRKQCPNADSDRMTLDAGFLKCPVDEFDSKFFGMSPMELGFTDPQQRLLLELCWEGLEDAAINPLTLKGSKTGIFTGTWIGDYYRMLIQNGSGDDEFYREFMGTSFGPTAGRLAHFFETVGSTIATESGCSSSIVAVGLAVKSLRRKETNLSLACGVNLILKPISYQAISSFISLDGHCKTFDAAADGYGRAEGVGVLVLKRLSDAVKDGDRIHALIRGYGEAQEGPSKSLGTPTVGVEALAMTIALEDAEVKPNEVQFVEFHGTGTPVGDPLEMEATAQVYSKNRTTPLYVGSVKANVGHSESCSGIAGIIKTVLSLKNEIIPPHRSLNRLNPKLDLQKIPAIIPMEPIAWKRQAGVKRLAGVNSFGITGTDAHVIIEEAPLLPKIWAKTKGKLPLNILALSAKSEDALNDLIKAYGKHLEHNLGGLTDVAFTANTGRAHFSNSFRASIIGKDCADVIKKIKNEIFVKQKSVSGGKPKLCFLFTGQGSQYHNMGKTLYENAPEFRKQFNLCDEILTKTHGIKIRDVLWGESESALLHRTLYSQTSIFCIEYCLTKLWESWGIIPDTVLGHSLGEFAAACAAGILSLNDALTLVAERSKLIDSLPSGKMIVVKADLNQTKNLLKQITNKGKDFILDFAAMNSPDQTALAGTTECVEEFKIFCENNKIKGHILDATHAFHSRQMDPILPVYRKVAQGINYGKPTCEFISGMEGKLLSNVDAEYWVRHTRESVNFVGASKAVYSEGCRAFLEIGPQPVLSAFIQTNLETKEESVKCYPSLRKKMDEWETILTALGSLYVHEFDIDWKNFYKHIPTQKVNVPFYQFQRKRYWFELSKDGKNIGTKFIGKELHPLIGAIFPNATNTQIFQSNLDINRESYLKDHMLGKHIILPGAGYLEMCLASGHASTLASFEDFHLPYYPVVLENLRIEAALGIKEEGLCEMQTVVSLDDGVNTDGDSCWNKVSIYRQQGESSGAKKWVRHATAIYSSIVMDLMDKETQDFEIIKSNFEEEIDISEFYEQLANIGMNFGPTFRSIKKLWKHKSEKLAQIQVPSETYEKGNAAYLCHPVVIDAMIQAIMIPEGKETQIKLSVPIFIQRFVWLGKSDVGQSINYIHVHEVMDDGSGLGGLAATLYSEDGKKLATMEGVTLVDTTLESITTALESQEMVLPRMFEEIWRAESKYGTVNLMEEDLLNSEDVKMLSDSVESKIPIPNIELMDMKIANEVISLYAMKSLKELDCNPNEGEKIQIDELIKNHGIIPQNKLLTRRFLEILCEQGICSQIGPMEFTVLKVFPSLDDIWNRIQLLSNSIMELKFEFQSMLLCLSKLTEVLKGKADVLSILFGEGESDSLAEKIYKEFKVMVRMNELFSQIMEHVIVHWLKNKVEGKILRILEIGAGTGSATRQLLPLLQKHKINYSYTFTDLSAMFFIRAESTFSAYKEHMIYKVLDIEKDPKSQGFPPNHYDIVVAVNVLHATKSLTQTLQNIRHLTAPRALISIVEQFKPIPTIDAIFGLVEGYWRFTDFDTRPYHCLVEAKKWMELLSKTGFESSTVLENNQDSGVILAQASNQIEDYKSSEETKSWILFASENESSITESFQSQLKSSGRNVILIKIGKYFSSSITPSGETEFTIRYEFMEDFTSLLEQAKSSGEIEGIIYLWGLGKDAKLNVLTRGYLNLIQSILSTKFGKNQLPKLVCVSEGAISVGDQEPGSPLAGPLWGMSRALKSEYSTMNIRCIDIDPSETSVRAKVSQAFSELWKNDHDLLVSYRSGIRHICRLTDKKIQLNPLTLPNSQRFSLILPSSKAINDLKFGRMGPTELKGNMIEIRMKAEALNFKDVLNILKPGTEFDNTNSVGADFAGIVTAIGPDVKNRKIGDAVFGCNFDNQPMPSHMSIEEDKVISLPTGMTFAEGSTLPAVFATSHHCLIDIANLQPGETILIHAASGGVGLTAIQLAKDIGAKIIATAGSRKKRAYLRSLGLDHVFHSREISFASEIKRVTGGEGVQMVLNSLTSPGFKEASLEICAPKARFVEMSKINIWTKEEVKLMRPDVNYTIVDLTAVTPETWKYLFKKLDKYLIEGRVLPIRYVRFDCVEIREALTYLQKAKHIGKVVCIMPEIEQVNGQWEMRHELFNDQSTYLITGGLGGIGLETSKWMAKQGAKHIVLCGRSEPTKKAQEVIDQLNNSDKNIVVIQSDVGDLKACVRLLDKIKNELPPLRGIMHAAGTLSDATYENQTWEKFEYTLNGKVNGAWNLHELTKEGYRLEHFVVFSSTASIFGSMGQSNHAAGNAFLDCLSNFRNTMGLPSTSINWGQWGQVGIVAELDIPGMSPFTPFQAFSSLELVLKSHLSQLAVMDVNISKLKITYPWVQNGYVKEIYMDLESSSELKTNEISNERFWEELETFTERNEKDQVISRAIEEILKFILRLELEETIEEHQTFQDLGLDSLMVVEFKNILQRLLGSKVILTAAQLTEANTIHLLTQKIGELMFGESDDKPTCSEEELQSCILQESILPEEIQPTEGFPELKDISKVLFTQTKNSFAPYILENLCKRNQIQKIYCILPKENAEQEVKIFLEGFKTRGLVLRMNKIKILHGSVGEPKFGLESKDYNELAVDIDAVLCSSLGKDNEQDNLQSIKKEGEEIKQILGFATETKTKWLLNVSNLFPRGKASEEESTLSESWPDSKEFETYKRMGYSGTTFLSHRLLAQAVERGIPCKVFRIPYLAGDTRSGYFELNKNHIFLRFMNYMQMGMMPLVAMPFALLPVDFCAEIVLKIFLEQPSAPSGIYNLTNPHKYSYKDFFQVSEEYGHPIRAVELDEFLTEMGKDGEKNSIVELVTTLYGDQNQLSNHQNLASISENKILTERVAAVFPDYLEMNETPLVTLKRDLKYAHEAGLFKKYGI